MNDSTQIHSGHLREVSWVFLKLGTIAFGGPAVHIAMMEDEVVRRRHWVTHEEFLDLLGATNLIPGPNSTELAIHLGYRRAGASVTRRQDAQCHSDMDTGRIKTSLADAP